MENNKEISDALENILDAAVKLVDGIKTVKGIITIDEARAESLKEMQDFSNVKKQISLEEVRKVLAELSRNDHTKEVKDLLRKYGSEKLSLIKPESYEALLKDAKEIK